MLRISSANYLLFVLILQFLKPTFLSFLFLLCNAYSLKPPQTHGLYIRCVSFPADSAPGSWPHCQVQVQCCFTSTEIKRTVRNEEPQDGHLAFTQFWSSETQLFVQCCFTSTAEIKRTVRDGEPRTATSTFTQLLTSETQLFVQCCFTCTEAIRTVSPGRPPLFHTAPVLCCTVSEKRVGGWGGVISELLPRCLTQFLTGSCARGRYTKWKDLYKREWQ